MQGKKKRLKFSELKRQLDVWKKHDQRMYSVLMQHAEQRGATDEFGQLSKENKEALNEFSEYYTRYIGNYTKYVRNEKRKYQKAKEEDTTNAKDFKEYMNKKAILNDLIEEFFNVFISDPRALPEIDYVKSLPIDEAIARLEKEIAMKEILPIEHYRETYGSFDPHWS